MNLESLTKAAQCAELLTSDITTAHALACYIDTPEGRLLTDALLPMIAESLLMQGKLKRLLRNCSPPMLE